MQRECAKVQLQAYSFATINKTLVGYGDKITKHIV